MVSGVNILGASLVSLYQNDLVERLLSKNSISFGALCSAIRHQHNKLSTSQSMSGKLVSDLAATRIRLRMVVSGTVLVCTEKYCVRSTRAH